MILFLYRFCVVDFVDIVDFVDFVDFLKTSPELKKHLFFLFKVYYSPMVDNCRERRSITRNFNNNYNNINIRNKLKVAKMKFFGKYKFLYIFIYK